MMIEREEREENLKPEPLIRPQRRQGNDVESPPLICCGFSQTLRPIGRARKFFLVALVSKLFVVGFQAVFGIDQLCTVVWGLSFPAECHYADCRFSDH